MNHTITVTNKTQLALFVHELSGQLSDGFWGNSRPSNHWETPCKATVHIGDTPSISFIPLRKYNFANKTLLEYVGDRMLQLCRFIQVFPLASDAVLGMIDSGDRWWKQTFTAKQQKWQQYCDATKTELAGYGIHNYNDLQNVLSNLDTTYDHKSMVKDLKVINQAFKNTL